MSTHDPDPPKPTSSNQPASPNPDTLGKTTDDQGADADTGAQNTQKRKWEPQTAPTWQGGNAPPSSGTPAGNTQAGNAPSPGGASAGGSRPTGGNTPSGSGAPAGPVRYPPALPAPSATTPPTPPAPPQQQQAAPVITTRPPSSTPPTPPQPAAPALKTRTDNSTAPTPTAQPSSPPPTTGPMPAVNVTNSGGGPQANPGWAPAAATRQPPSTATASPQTAATSGGAKRHWFPTFRGNSPSGQRLFHAVHIPGYSLGRTRYRDDDEPSDTFVWTTIFVVTIILIATLFGIGLAPLLVPILMALSIPLLLGVISLLILAVVVLLTVLVLSSLRRQKTPDAPQTSRQSATVHRHHKSSKDPKGHTGMASEANDDDDDVDGGPVRPDLSDDETQPYNQQTVPVPALKKPRPEPPAPPPPPQPLLQTRQVVDDDNDDDEAVWEKKYTWVDPDPFPKQEKENHPHDRGDWLPFGEKWVIAAASARGLEHRNGKYRDDDYAIRVLSLPGKGFFQKNSGMPYAAIIAIADGLGSRPLSRHGARAATQGAVAVDESLVRAIYERLKTPHSLDEIRAQAEVLFKAVFKSAAERVTKQAKQDDVGVDDLHSTLILIVAILSPHDPNRLTMIASQAGDGSVYTVERATSPATPSTPSTTDPDTSSPDAQDTAGNGSPDNGQDWIWLLKPQVEPTGTQVTPFMVRYNGNQERLLDDMKGRSDRPLECLLAMTDGPAEVLTPYAPASGTADDFQHARPFFVDVTAVLRQTYAENVGETRGMAFEKKAKELLQRKLRIGDDVTLVCLFHRDLLKVK